MDLTTAKDYRVRELRWWDLDEVVALEAELFPHDPWSATQWWTELAQPTRDYVVLEDNGVIAGFAGIFTAGSSSDLQTIGVRTTAQGRGLGGRLLDDVMTRATQAGAREMLLEVREDNLSAINVYQRHRFSTIARRSRYYPDGSTALIMRADLGITP